MAKSATKGKAPDLTSTDPIAPVNSVRFGTADRINILIPNYRDIE